jgi:hypothetical protein
LRSATIDGAACRTTFGGVAAAASACSASTLQGVQRSCLCWHEQRIRKLSPQSAS